MGDTFPAYLISKTDSDQQVEFIQLRDDDLMEGDVMVDVEYTTVNYKDALALTGKGPVIRRFPLVPGIDLAGTVRTSTHPDFKPGDCVICNGFGLGEQHYGGHAARARVSGDWLLPLPKGLTTRQAMAIGTAGYTAMLCVMALQGHDIKPDDGDILVTGATGGVGSIATALLAGLGYRVTAVTGRASEHDYLKQLGATQIIDRSEFSDSAKPLAKERWAGAVDVAGGNTLANVLSQMSYGGAVAACGLADSLSLPTTVAPFILRGVTLYGIDSVMAPMAKRRTAWQRLSSELDLELLERMISEYAFTDLPAVASSLLKGELRGRAVVNVRN